MPIGQHHFFNYLRVPTSRKLVLFTKCSHFDFYVGDHSSCSHHHMLFFSVIRNQCYALNMASINSEQADTTAHEIETTSTIKRKRRLAISDAERRKIRRRAASHPGKQQELAEWFEQETGRRLAQGKISEILSSKYQHLDNDKRKDGALDSQRQSVADHPDLEGALFEWQQKIQKKKGIVTGHVLKAKAHDIWVALPQKKDLEEPKWSTGWLDRFKKRHNIKEYVNHGEAGTAQINNPENLRHMTVVRNKAKKYERRDILNFDETGLNWKLTPNRTLATEQSSGGKKLKDRITIGLTCSADGSGKYKPWVVGKSKNPRCFKNVKNRRLLGVEYRYNNSKWMTGKIMVEYLNWLNSMMKSENRKVLLLMDNFSAHESAVKELGGETALSNVEIE